MTETPRDTSSEILDRVYALKDVDEAERVYDDWADSYDADTVQGLGYVGPAVAAAKLAELVRSGVVLDAGCGTGLAGLELAERTDVTVDGVDLSQGMLDRAHARGVYRRLSRADLTQPLDIEDDTYDAALCVGTFTEGHVGPEAFDELVRVVAELEQGAPTLEHSLALWERGEALAARCEEWLVGAKRRLDAARAEASGDDA